MEEIINEVNFWWALDREEKTVIPYELFWGNSILPSKFVYDDWIINNQWRSWEYAYSCVFFWEANSINEIRFDKKIKEVVKWETLADYAEKTWRLNKKSWAYLIDWPKVSRELWLIDWYTQVDWLDNIKRAIYENWPVWIWSNSFNWSKALKAPYYVSEGKSYWHKAILVGYDDEKQILIWENSYWKELFDKWRFYIPYNLIHLLYSTKTANFINDNRFKILNYYLQESKKMNSTIFYNSHIKNENDELNKWLAKLASQIRYIWKINSKELLELIK